MKKGIVLKSFVLSLGLGLFMSSCSEPVEVEKYTFIQKQNFTGEDSLVDLYSRTKGEAHSGSYFSRTDSTNQYGIGAIMAVNDTNLTKDMRININLWCRANLIEPGYMFAVSVVDGDKMASWSELDIKKQITAVNTWTNVKDSVTIPAAIFNKPGLIIKAFAFNPNNAAKTIVFDQDDLEITFKKVDKVLEE